MDEQKDTRTKIMIVEDNFPLLKALSTRVNNLGYHVIEATNGIMAINKFLQFEPDLILLDLMMPQMSGFEVLSEIRSIHKSNVPVIIISNLNQKLDRQTAKNLGAAEYIVKSETSLQDLGEKIKKVLGE
jgi:CheY-like chemotaxis protein